jgi:hypothetical protein
MPAAGLRRALDTSANQKDIDELYNRETYFFSRYARCDSKNSENNQQVLAEVFSVNICVLSSWLDLS